MKEDKEKEKEAEGVVDPATEEDLELILILKLLRKHFGDDPAFVRYVERRRHLLDAPLGPLSRDFDQLHSLSSLSYPELFKRAQDFHDLQEARKIQTRLLGHLEDVDDRVRDQSKSLKGFGKQLEESQEKTNRKLLETTDVLHSTLWLIESGADIREARLRRSIPIRIFIGDPMPDLRDCNKLMRAVNSFIYPMGFDQLYELPAESGSWWKRFCFQSRQFLTHDEVQARVKKAEQALEVRYLDKPQAEANHLQAQAAAEVIGALKTTPNACIQAGSLLVVKQTRADGKSAIVTRTLSTGELKKLEENQAVLRQPDAILEFLGLPQPQG